MPPTNKPDAPKPAGRSSSPATASGDGAAPPSPLKPSHEDAEQAKLDAEAAQKAKDAEDAAALAEAEAAEAQKAAEAAENYGLPRAKRCPEPDCRERLERYSGSNPHKLGSYVCPVHGRRAL